ncbi:acetolactate synthase, large subunit [Ferrimonas balearica DSM 9799]|uniref:Acetolactate synthase n=1 Tax=Ferrimonas balearica (strain DSM 9799 / CCM 4581 / KCTC 23876 / PAT) TaxID=550540 RepID=E1SPM9_FERBD|nr:acetolactate synthase 2 catalytic subunit [Ferrimonas balearica]ADN77846.1 acetolactate synthase, large subunit [Ferrimonas balearica DSM 9799]
MISGAEAVVRALAEQGVRTLFGYPGGAIMPIYDALYDSPVEHLLCRHEQGAAFAAIGYARASGKVGVCMATSGPGATNLITALADAMMDSIPVVAITGQVPSAAIGTDAFQEIDVLGLSLACTKHSFLVSSPDTLCDTLHQAFELAAEGRPGPVLVDIPKDVQQAMVAYHGRPRALPQAANDTFELEAAQAMLADSRKPLLYVGGGVGMAGAVAELRDFIRVTGMPSVTTLKGIGAIAHGTPGFLGMLGMHGSRAANQAVQECDLLIAVGARFDDRVTGKLDAFAPTAKVIHLDIDPAEISKRRDAMVSYCGDLRRVLPALAMPMDVSEWRDHCDEQKQQCAHRYDHPGATIYAPALLKRLAETLPRNAMVSCDVGQHQMWVAQHMWFDSPSNHLSSAGLGTMGFGLPAAIGAQLARPDDLSLLVSGDGSFMMNVQELTTIKRARLPLKIVLLDNQRLGMVKQWQELFFEERFSETDLSDNPDFVTMAAAFNIPGRHIWRKDQVEEAMAEMLAAEGPYLLHVSISEKENVWPLVPPGASNDEMMEEKR